MRIFYSPKIIPPPLIITLNLALNLGQTSYLGHIQSKSYSPQLRTMFLPQQPLYQVIILATLLRVLSQVSLLLNILLLPLLLAPLLRLSLLRILTSLPMFGMMRPLSLYSGIVTRILPMLMKTQAICSMILVTILLL